MTPSSRADAGIAGQQSWPAHRGRAMLVRSRTRLAPSNSRYLATEDVVPVWGHYQCSVISPHVFEIASNQVVLEANYSQQQKETATVAGLTFRSVGNQATVRPSPESACARRVFVT